MRQDTLGAHTSSIGRTPDKIKKVEFFEDSKADSP